MSLTSIVPCNGCTACCRGELVVICEEIDGDPGKWDTVALAECGEAGVLANEMMHGFGDLRVLRQVEGACVYLGDQGCTIYERRPAMCRSFDCRAMVRDVLLGKCPGSLEGPVMRAGLERLPSLRE